ncbi:MAG: hypothetical protein MI743_17145 [Sneathiellales bacterium]|nr:hypothetical protein [Sneathiellales bacterium]
MQRKYKNFHRAVSRLVIHRTLVKERYRRRGRPATVPLAKNPTVHTDFPQPANHKSIEPEIVLTISTPWPIACPVPVYEEDSPANHIPAPAKRSFLSRLFDLSPRRPQKSKLEN